MNLLHKFSEKKIFWKLRTYSSKTVFKIKKIIYLFKSRFNDQSFRFKISSNIFKQVYPQILKVIILTLILILVEIYTKEFWSSINHFLPELLNNLILRTKIVYSDSIREQVIQYLIAIASISGIILGLFYPVLATIASTTYAKVRSNVRNLLILEPQSQAFLRQISFLTASILVILFAMFFSYNPNLIVLIFIAFNVLRVLYTLLNLGMGIFRYFDPSNLIYIITIDLRKYVIEATSDGFYWNDRNFQNYYRQLTNNKLEELKAIIGICSSEKYLRAESFSKTYEQMLAFLIFYITSKHKIPVDSLWYPQRNTHKPFFLADSTSIQMAERTEMFIQPRQRTDYNWIESYVLEVIFNGFKELVQNGETELIANNALRILSYFSKYLGENADFDTSRILLEKLDYLIKEIFQKNYKSEKESFLESMSELGIVEFYSEILTEIMLGFFREVESMKASKFEEIIANKIQWNKKQQMYIYKFFPKFYQHLEEIRKNLNFEINVESRIITPKWYILQYASGYYIDMVENGLDTILNMFEEHLIELSKYFSDKKQRLPLLILAHIGLHICWKFSANLNNMYPIFEEFQKFKIQSGIHWKKLDINKLYERNNVNRNYFKDIIFENCKYVASLNWSEDNIDIFGESYKVMTKEMNDILYFNKEQDFKKYFPLFFDVAIFAYDKIREYAKNRGYNIESFARITSQTIIDLLHISGLSLIYSELYENETYKEICILSWNKLLSSFENFDDEKYFINLLVLNYSVFQKQHLYFDALNHRKFYRDRSLEEKFRELKIVKEYHPFSEAEPEEHKSLLIELIKPGYHYSLHYDVAEIFIELYLFTHISAKDSIHVFNRNFFEQINRYFKYKRTK